MYVQIQDAYKVKSNIVVAKMQDQKLKIKIMSNNKKLK